MGKVYDRYFDQYFPTAEIIYPDIVYQSKVTRGIINVKNKNRFLPPNHADRPKRIFIEVCDHLVLRGAEVIISGCTDIAVDFLPDDYPKYLVIDFLSILANNIASC
jgi:aspartate/glutamate racemase